MTFAELLALLPIVILALGGTLVLMLGAWWPQSGLLAWAGVLLALGSAATTILVPAPVAEVGGMFSAAAYGRFFLFCWSLLAALILLLSMRYGKERNFRMGEYSALVLFCAMGMSLLSAASSLVGFFLGLEAFTLVLYVLIGFYQKGTSGAEAGLKYLVMGVVATALLAFGIALIFAASGTFHLPEAMQGVMAGARLRPWGLLGWALVIAATGFKVSLVPFHLWTPDVYQGAPAPVTALLAAGSKGAVFSALVVVASALGPGWKELTPVIWMLSAITMVVGTLSALRQENVKRLLAYSSIVHMGLLLMGLLALGKEGRSAIVFYIIFYAAASVGSFGVITSFCGKGEEPQSLSQYQGMGFRHPFQTAAFALFLLALAGIPPTGGFMAKLGLFYATIKAGHVGLAILAVVVSLVSAYYYLKILVALFMRQDEAHSKALHPGSWMERLVLGFCSVAVLGLGLFPEPILRWIEDIL